MMGPRMDYVVAIDLLIVTLAWVATVFRFEAVVKSVRKGRSRFLRPWLFALTLSLFATFQVDFVHRAFDSLVGVNNLSWLISYLFGAPAIYFICISFCDELPRWTSIYLLVTLALLIALFPLGPARAPETSEQDIPFNGFEYLFLVVFYIYATVVFVSLPIPVCAGAFRSQKSLAVRWRTGVILLAMGLIVSLYFIKVTVWSLGFFLPERSLPIVRFAAEVLRIQGLGVGILWPLSFAPDGLYRASARLAGYYQKIRTLIEVNNLRCRINRLCPSSALYQPTWRDQLSSPDFHIYRNVIDILDGRKLLSGYLEQEGPDSDQASAVPGRDSRWHRSATRLHQVLADLPVQSEFDSLVDGCRHVRRQLKGAA